MSQAVLRARYPHTVEPALPIETVAQKKVLREVDLPSEYIELIYDKTKASISEEADHEKQPGALFVAAAVGTALIILCGLIVGYLWPGPAGVILPVGLGLWWLLYKLAHRNKQLV